MVEEKPRYSRISDILDLIILMQSRTLGITLKDIEKQLNVTRRTAERIRDALILGLPQVDEIPTDGKEKHWGFISGYTINEVINFTPKEIAILESIKESSQTEDKKQILDAVITKLKAHSKKQITKIEDAIELILKSEGVAVSQRPSHKISVQMLDVIRNAIKEKTMIECEYLGNHKTLAPYGIIYGSSVYLIAVEEGKLNPYVYSLHKIGKVYSTLKKFDKGDFDIKEYASHSFGVYQNEVMKVELLFSQDVADEVLNYNFHPTQKIKQNEDGTVTVKFKASGELEIIWHIFRWGNNVKIVSPTKLRKMYVEYLENVLKIQR